MAGAAPGGTRHRGAALTGARSATSATDPVAVAEREHARALNDAFRGRYDLSSRRLRRALDLLGFPSAGLAAEGSVHDDVSAQRVRIRLLVLLAGMEYELSGGEAGRDHLDEAITASHTIGWVSAPTTRSRLSSQTRSTHPSGTTRCAPSTRASLSHTHATTRSRPTGGRYSR